MLNVLENVRLSLEGREDLGARVLAVAVGLAGCEEIGEHLDRVEGSSS